MASRTSITEKIQLLLNKAERTNFPEEAEAFFAAAQKLMVRHAIDQSMLPGNDEKREKIGPREIRFNPRDEIFISKALLIHYIAIANRCTTFKNRGTGTVTIIGFEADTEFVEMLFQSVMIQYAAARNRGWKEYDGPESRYLWVNAFAQGYVVRIGERLKEMAAVSTAEETAGTGQELVLVDRTRQVHDYVAENYRLRKGKSITYRGGQGRSSGYSAANNADLTGGRNNLGGGRKGIGR